VRVCKTRHFDRFARRERISDLRLCDAAERAERGLVDPDLGRGLIKQRIARQGQGHSSGYRTLFAHQANKRAVFVYGFTKNERDNIDVGELEYWRGVARALLAMTETEDADRATRTHGGELQ
jgi:hypothetical protein